MTEEVSVRKSIRQRVAERIYSHPYSPHGGREAKSKTGSTQTSFQWEDRRPHPDHLYELEKLNKDPEVETAITMLTEMTIGVGISTSIKGLEPEAKATANQKIIDQYILDAKLSPDIKASIRVMFEKGFCPIELLDDGAIKPLPPETFFIWRKPTDKTPYKFTQEVMKNSPVATWEGTELNKIMIIANKATPTNPYGIAVAMPIIEQLKARITMTADVARIIHKIGYPFRIHRADSTEIIDEVYDQCVNRESDEDIFIGNVKQGQYEIFKETLNPRVDFSPHVTANDELIAQGLNAPLVRYLKNATEASATKILEVDDRYIQGIQTYVAMMIEAILFKPRCGTPIPKCSWGMPKTGLEKISLTDISALYNGGNGAITWNQAQDLIVELGIPIKKEEEKPLPKQPNQTPLKDLPPLLDITRTSTLRQALGVIKDAWDERRMSLGEALKEGDRVISIHVERARHDALSKLSVDLQENKITLSPEAEAHFKLIQMEILDAFRQELLPTGVHGEPHGKPRFTVIPEQ